MAGRSCKYDVGTKVIVLPSGVHGTVTRCPETLMNGTRVKDYLISCENQAIKWVKAQASSLRLDPKYAQVHPETANPVSGAAAGLGGLVMKTQTPRVKNASPKPTVPQSEARPLQLQESWSSPLIFNTSLNQHQQSGPYPQSKVVPKRGPLPATTYRPQEPDAAPPHDESHVLSVSASHSFAVDPAKFNQTPSPPKVAPHMPEAASTCGPNTSDFAPFARTQLHKVNIGDQVFTNDGSSPAGNDAYAETAVGNAETDAGTQRLSPGRQKAHWHGPSEQHGTSNVADLPLHGVPSGATSCPQQSSELSISDSGTTVLQAGMILPCTSRQFFAVEMTMMTNELEISAFSVDDEAELRVTVPVEDSHIELDAIKQDLSVVDGRLCVGSSVSGSSVFGSSLGSSVDSEGSASRKRKASDSSSEEMYEQKYKRLKHLIRISGSDAIRFCTDSGSDSE